MIAADPKLGEVLRRRFPAWTWESREVGWIGSCGDQLACFDARSRNGSVGPRDAALVIILSAGEGRKSGRPPTELTGRGWRERVADLAERMLAERATVQFC